MSKETEKTNSLPATPQLDAYFQTASDKIWHEAAEKLLKGKPFDKILRSRTIEGFTLEPIYHTAAKIAALTQSEYPGLAPFKRGSHARGSSNGWFTAQRVNSGSVGEANDIILEGLKNGENAVCISLSLNENDAQDAIALRNLSDLQLLFSEVDLSAVPLYCYCGGASAALTAGLSKLLAEIGSNATVLRGWLMNDPITQLAANGNLSAPVNEILEDQVALYRIANTHFPNLKVLGVDMRPWHNAGASATQELGISLAIGAHYLRSLLREEKNISASDVLKNFQLAFAVGSDFFMEIAKLRAARIVWHYMISSFDNKPSNIGVSIHCETSTWNKTLYDPHVNMLRTTTEAMSAVMGGCESLTILPFDEIINGGNAFSRRIARNTHHLLRDESGFHQVIDPAGGSPFIETLTQQLAKQAWDEFREIEASGGIEESLISGAVLERVALTAEQRMNGVNRAKTVFVGTNKYANAAEKSAPNTPNLQMSDDLTFIDSDKTITWLPPLRLSEDGAFEKLQDALAGRLYFAQISEALGYAVNSGSGKTITPLQRYRGAVVFETLRARTEQIPEELLNEAATLICLGKPSEYRARADYTDGILAIAGLKAKRITQLESLEKAVESLKSIQSGILVFCSTDTIYADWITPILQRSEKKNTQRFLLAGKPGDHEENWRKAGMDSFIHLGCNVLNELKAVVKALEDVR